MRPYLLISISILKETSRLLYALLDWQSNPESVTALAKLTGWDVIVVKGVGHMLPKDYVGVVLKGWCIG
jgi:hypothetical protein